MFFSFLCDPRLQPGYVTLSFLNSASICPMCTLSAKDPAPGSPLFGLQIPTPADGGVAAMSPLPMLTSSDISLVSFMCQGDVVAVVPGEFTVTDLQSAVGAASGSPDALPCGAGTIDIKFEVTLDNKPEEMSWVFQVRRDG